MDIKNSLSILINIFLIIKSKQQQKCQHKQNSLTY